MSAPLVAGHGRPRSPRRALATVLVLAAAVVGILDAAAGAAAPAARPGHKGIDVVQVEGFLDPPNVSLVLDAIDNANRSGATMLIIRLDSKGAVDVDTSKIVRAIQRSQVPVVGVGRSVGRRGEGRRDPRARRGPRRLRRAGLQRRPRPPGASSTIPTDPGRAAVRATLAALAKSGQRSVAATQRLTTHEVSADTRVAHAARSTGSARPSAR